MKILTQILRILLIFVDSIWLFVVARFMFVMRWDVTSRIFEDWISFQVIAPQYLELLMLVLSLTILTFYFRHSKYPIRTSIILNVVACIAAFFVGMHM